jgi:hypothetical protein
MTGQNNLESPELQTVFITFTEFLLGLLDSSEVFCINEFFTMKCVACAWLIMIMIRYFLVPFKHVKFQPETVN